MIAVIGGGPAGIMAALAAAENGGQVILVERNAALGRKLLLTGNGRCNLTNAADLETLVRKTPGNGVFLYGAFSRFGPDDLRAFLAARGLSTVCEDGGRVFPAHGGAPAVLDALRRALAARGVRVLQNTLAIGLHINGGRLTGVETTGGLLPAEAVILAAGGASFPATGSDGSGYGLARAAGHRVTPLLPSLVPLCIAENWPAGLSGLSLSQAGLVLRSEREVLAARCGEILFTHRGLSGPAAMALGRRAAGALAEGARLTLSLDCLPDLALEELDRLLLAEEHAAGRRSLRRALESRLPARLRSVILDLAGLAPDKPLHQLTKAERGRWAETCKNLILSVTGTAPLSEAYVTAGGVDLAEVSPRTMASRLVGGLYFAGEILDVDGDSGGFNLQAAFSTGHLAGASAARGEA